MSSASQIPGVVFLVTVRKVGRRKSFGSVALYDGHRVVVVGYTEDGSTICYAPTRALANVRARMNKAEHRIGYRMLSWIMKRYEVSGA
jgi:hypothetical protein